MSEQSKITVEPLSFGLTGFKVEDLILEKFREEVKKEFPNGVLGHIMIFFPEPKQFLSISHDISGTSVNTNRVDVEGTDQDLVKRAIEMLKRVFA